jgi:hypothetical protein
MGVPGGGQQPPSLLGKQSQSGNIRLTVGQYWLIIKINGTNSVKIILWEICYLVGNFRNPPPPPPPPPSTTLLESFSGKFFLTTRAQSEKVGQISFCPPNFSLPIRPFFLSRLHFSLQMGSHHSIPRVRCLRRRLEFMPLLLVKLHTKKHVLQ